MSCFGGHEEQLWLVELLVENLKLPAETFKEVACGDNGADCPLVVKIKFLDFPTFEISQQDFYFIKATPRDETGCLDFSAGRACLFVKQPRDLVKAMKSTPLKIGIFRANDTYPIAETEVELSGCLCNQVSMASNDADHMPPPYTLKSSYYLTDPGKNPSGTINLDFRLTCLGKSVTTHYQLNKKSFFFKNDRDDNRYYVKRILPVATCADEAGKDSMKCGDSMLPSTGPYDELEQVPTDLKKPEDEKTDGNGKKNKKKGTKKKNVKKK